MALPAPLRALLEQLPARGPSRAFVIVALAVGGLVALAVPVFFGIMLWDVLTAPPAP